VVTWRPADKSRRKAAIVERSEGVERVGRPGWRRLRSGALLVALLVGLGAAAAAVIGVLALAMAALMDQALG
jgi:hypothetical protein